ncbi:nucleoside triphosphate pyrophosphohydrolase [Senegalia massiliensis]|nr:nucleoside triphosphate pyrophosphohydrolase [Senegalia massiliensis]
MSIINIIGLGFGDVSDLNFKSIKALEKHKNFFRTDKSPIIYYLNEKDIDYSSYDYIYETEDNFDNVYINIVNDLIENSKKYSVINYCVPKSPLLFDKVTQILLNHQMDKQIKINVYNNGGFIESVFNVLEKPMTSNIKVIDASDIKATTLDLNSDLIIFGIYDNLIASEIKIHLEEIYSDNHPIEIINSFFDKKKYSIPLYKLDRLDEYNYDSTIYIPKTNSNKNSYDMNNLIEIMERLRSKDGCMWDNEQTFESLRAYLIEESYEVVDAIDRDDIDALEEELGDLLLQVVFLSQIAREEGYFNIWHVISSISNKMIYRHPHVFSDTLVNGIDDISYNWDKLKNKNKDINTITESMMSIPKEFPTLLKAYKIQKKASKVGFDWDYKEDAYKKIQEEIIELKVAIDEKVIENIEDEFGDLLFAIINFGRFLNVNPETALNKTINKFISRFKYIEDTILKQGKRLEESNLEDMEKLWNEAKNI